MSAIAPVLEAVTNPENAPITGIAARYAGPIPLSAPASAWETPPAESVRPNAT